MLTAFSRYWWMVALRGVLAILFGILAFTWPGATLVVLVWLFGAYALFDGIVAFVAAVRHEERGNRWSALVAEAVGGIGVGIVAFAWPGITAIAMVYLVAAWALFTGIMEILVAFELRRTLANEWLLIAGGAI